MIAENILNKLPEWYKDINRDKQYLVLSNDFDSYFSCKALDELFGIDIGGFYDFESGLWLNKDITRGREPIYVDLAMTKGKCFDNHMNYIRNPEAINPNIITSTYYKKYNGGTLPFVCGLFDVDLSKKTETNLKTLLTVDSWYRGYYKDDGKWKDVNIYWMKQLGMLDYLLRLLQQNNEKSFIDFEFEHHLKEHININDGFLQCALNISLPREQFELVLPVQKKFVSDYEIRNINKEKIIVDARPYRNSYVINIKKAS